MKIKIHPTAIVMIAFFIWNKSFAKLLLAVILHELGHSLAAFIVGKRNQVFTLTPLGCSLYVGEIHGRLRSIFVYAAGPLVSLLLAPVLSPQTLWVLAFNLFPVLPLDGGRIAAAILGERFCGVLGGLTLLGAMELCFLHNINPVGPVIILLLHSRYLASAQLTKIRQAADFFRDLY